MDDRCCRKTMHRRDDASTRSSVEKFSNGNYETDLKRTIFCTKWLLRLLGVWPMVTKTSSTLEKYISKGLIIVCSIALAFTILPTGFHMFLREKDPFVRVILAGPVFFFSSNFLKHGLIVFRSETIMTCLKHVENDWKRIASERDRAIMRRNVKLGESLTFACGVFVYIGEMGYHAAMPIWSGNAINEFNETARPLVYPGYDIFIDPQSSPAYEIIFCVCCAAAFVICIITTACCNIAALLVTHACGQIEIIVSRLATLFDGMDDEERADELDERISFVIESHVRVLKLSSGSEEVLREICLVEMVTSTLTICLLEYYCMTEWKNSETVAIITYVVLLISLTFNIFIFCHIGELLREQCHRVATASYMIEWYKLPGTTGRALVMVIAIANCPRKISAGGMMELTIASFGSIIQTTLVYLNLVRRIAE